MVHVMMLSTVVGHCYAAGCLISNNKLRTSVCGALIDEVHRDIDDDAMFGG